MIFHHIPPHPYHGLGRVHLEVWRGPEVSLVSLSPVVVVAAVLVTDPVKPVVGLIVPALHSLTPVLAFNITGMVGVGAALRVRFPDVELEAAGTVVTHASID